MVGVWQPGKIPHPLFWCPKKRQLLEPQQWQPDPPGRGMKHPCFIGCNKKWRLMWPEDGIPRYVNGSTPPYIYNINAYNFTVQPWEPIFIGWTLVLLKRLVRPPLPVQDGASLFPSLAICSGCLRLTIRGCSIIIAINESEAPTATSYVCWILLLSDFSPNKNNSSVYLYASISIYYYIL